MSRALDPHQLQDLLSRQLSDQGLEVDLVAIPAHGDRGVRARSLEEALEDFDSGNSGTTSYLVRVRPSSPTLPTGISVSDAVDRVADRTRPEKAPTPKDAGIYLTDGKPNIPYLEQNAELLRQSGEFVLARNIWHTLLQSGERPDLAHRGLGLCYEAEGKLPEAIRHYEDSIAYQPTLEAYQRLGQILIRARRDQEAAETLQRAIALRELSDEVRAELHKACGNCWMRAEQTAKAEKHYRSVLAIQPNNDSVLTNLGALELQMGRLAEARNRFETAAQLNSRNDQAASGIGACFIASGEKRQAHDAFAHALEINPVNSTAIFHLVKIAYELKTYSVATRLLEEYIESAPVNANLLYSLAGMQYHLNRRPEARATILKILEMQPEHSGAKDLLSLMGA